MLYYQELPVVPESIEIKLISKYYNNLLAKHFDINKMRVVIS